jgi:hypothetical protein
MLERVGHYWNLFIHSFRPSITMVFGRPPYYEHVTTAESQALSFGVEWIILYARAARRRVLSKPAGCLGNELVVMFRGFNGLGGLRRSHQKHQTSQDAEACT